MPFPIGVFVNPKSTRRERSHRKQVVKCKHAFDIPPRVVLFDTTNPILGNVGKIVGFGWKDLRKKLHKQEEGTYKLSRV